MTAATSHTITEQEYLQLEERAAVRHEFINGKMYEIPEGTSYHHFILLSIAIFFRKIGLTAFADGMRVRQADTKNYYYPDVVVTLQKLKKKVAEENPVLLVEVLSPSTRTNDLSDKFIAYRQFATLEYYIVVEPEFCYVNLFSKDENGEWQSDVYTQLTDKVPLPKLQANLPVAYIYEGLEWTEG